MRCAQSFWCKMSLGTISRRSLHCWNALYDFPPIFALLERIVRFPANICIAGTLCTIFRKYLHCWNALYDFSPIFAFLERTDVLDSISNSSTRGCVIPQRDDEWNVPPFWVRKHSCDCFTLQTHSGSTQQRPSRTSLVVGALHWPIFSATYCNKSSLRIDQCSSHSPQMVADGNLLQQQTWFLCRGPLWGFCVHGRQIWCRHRCGRVHQTLRQERTFPRTWAGQQEQRLREREVRR